jgi:endogenous inhibitor of DNA gyrase (YacG/DUF329 family)
VRCPICKKEIDPDSTRFLPFCSKRCKLIDLGRWFEEDYRIPGEPAPVPENPREDDEKDEH